MGKVAIALCIVAALVVGGWRLLHPPITQRMKHELAAGESHIEACAFHKAYDAFRRAAALDGADPGPRKDLRLAIRGIADFDRHRRFAKGCGVLESAGQLTSAIRRVPIDDIQ